MKDTPELFLFTHGMDAYAFTSADRDLTYDSIAYAATYITRSGFEVGEDTNRADMSVKIDIDNALAQEFLNNVVDGIVHLTVYKLNPDGVTADTLWKGRVSAYKPSRSEVELTCESKFTSMLRTGCRAKILRTCTKKLYSAGCGVNKEDFAVTGSPTSLSGTTLVIAAASTKPDNWFAGGMVKTSDGVYRFILRHSGSNLTLSRPMLKLAADIANLGAGAISLTLYPGCDKLRSTCNSKYANGENFGGFAWLPTKHPFDGTAVG